MENYSWTQCSSTQCFPLASSAQNRSGSSQRERGRERERKTKREVSDREAEIERISLRGDDKTEGGGGEGEAARCSIKELQRPPRAQTEQAAGGI